MMSHRILPAALVLCTLFAACGELPTRSDPDAQPAGPAYDGGYTIGSGGSAVASGGYTIGSGGSAKAEGDYVDESVDGTGTDDAGTSTQSGGDAQRGGYTIGSGG